MRTAETDMSNVMPSVIAPFLRLKFVPFCTRHHLIFQYAHLLEALFQSFWELLHDAASSHPANLHVGFIQNTLLGPDVVSYTACVSACAQSMRWREMLELCEEQLRCTPMGLSCFNKCLKRLLHPTRFFFIFFQSFEIV